MRIAVEIGVLLPVVASTASLRAARLGSAGPLAWVLGIVIAGVLLAGARVAVVLAVARLAAVVLSATGILSPRMGISRILAAGILAAAGILTAGVGHSGERPARIWPSRVDAALSADGIAAVGRHPGGDIDGPVPLLRLRRRRWGHN